MHKDACKHRMFSSCYVQAMSSNYKALSCTRGFDTRLLTSPGGYTGLFRSIYMDEREAGLPQPEHCKFDMYLNKDARLLLARAPVEVRNNEPCSSASCIL